MKTGSIPFLLVAITTIGSVVADVNKVVYHTDGEPVKTNVPYYVTFRTLENGMWICRSNMGHDPMSCPQQPVMFTSPNIQPTPIKFVLPSSNLSGQIVHESTEFNIKFATRDRCGESGFWRVVRNHTSLQGEVVLSGSKSSNDSKFTIEKPNEYYTFIFGNNDDRTTISLTNEPISMLISKKYSGEMEVSFYRAISY